MGLIWTKNHLVLRDLLYFVDCSFSWPMSAGECPRRSPYSLWVVVQTDWDDRYLLDMCEKAHFYQVCGFIYNNRHQYIAALDSFMKDADEPSHAFSYTHNLLSDKRLDYLEAAVISRISDLVQISREFRRGGRLLLFFIEEEDKDEGR
ncbi:hypothetical protein Hanom_Chr14g01279831 [Helianthus anomalus]